MCIVWGWNMKNIRRDTLREYIQEKGQIHLKDLEKLFPLVSTMTLRRDMDYLEEKGYILRIRGGARAINRLSGPKEDVFSQRLMENTDAKNQIAKKAVDLMERGRSIFVDSGTTMMCLAKLIPDENYSIFTSGPNIGLQILKNQKPSISLIGGQLSRNNLSSSGLISEEIIKKINIDMAFMSTSGFSLDSGFTIGDLNESNLKRAIIKKAKKTILLMDLDKLDKNLPFTFAVLKDIDFLITDGTLPDYIQKAAEKYSVQII